MSLDRHGKKRKKRQKKIEERRRQRERIATKERAYILAWEAEQAYYFRQYRVALAKLQKALKELPKEDFLMHLAIKAAKKCGEQEALYNLYLSCLEEDRGFLTPKEYLDLGKMAFSRKHYSVTEKAFSAFLFYAEKGVVNPPKKLMDDIKRTLAWCSSSQSSANQEEPPRDKPLPGDRDLVPKMGQVQPSKGLATQDQLSPRVATSQVPEGIDRLEVSVGFETDCDELLRVARERRQSQLEDLELALKGYSLSFRASFEHLICLSTLRDVKSLWYQEETARKVMRAFRGRAILADEVGLGKTIEAGLILKEYILRGLVRSALVLAPSSLVSQWKEELLEKFGLSFVTTNDSSLRDEPERFWQEPFIVASLQTARTRRQWEAVTSRSYDMVVVDEAHHLKNRTTANWKLVYSLRSTFLLLLTATPVQNNLEELFNLVTLLKPGHLKTRKAFMQEFVSRGSPTDPRNREKLRELLKEVMVRNTRAVARLELPPRFATTIRVSPSPLEAQFYETASQFVTNQARVRQDSLSRLRLKHLLEAAGSSPFAATKVIEGIRHGSDNGTLEELELLLSLALEIGETSKTRRMLELIQASSSQKIVFVNHLATLEHIHEVLDRHKIPHVIFHGGLARNQKQGAMDSFRKGCPVLLATGIGGEGYNLQFCHTMINYDLPWNPMQIEQRIGRIHRIGQDKEVQIYNLCAAGTIEDHILEVLDRKINMFELVIGELDMILGRLRGEEEFSELVYRIWVENPDEAARAEAFEALAKRLRRARVAHERSKELDEKLFRGDFGV